MPMPDDDPNLTSEENKKRWGEYKQKKKNTLNYL
jgi:hypothetical protein